MSSIVYQTRNGTTYAYRSTSHRDPDSKEPVTDRTYLGRVDPDTGMIIPKAEKGKRNRSKIGKSNKQLPENFLQEYQQLRQQNADLQKEVEALKKENEAGNNLILQMKQLIQSYEPPTAS